MTSLYSWATFLPRSLYKNVVGKMSNAWTRVKSLRTDSYFPGRDVKSSEDITKANNIPSENRYKWDRIKTTSMYTVAFAALQHPDVMLGPIPFYSAQMVEVATSEDVLKFRSVGAQFLAHQHGGNYAVRIDLKLVGETAPYMLHVLNYLHQYGDSESVTSQSDLNLIASSTALSSIGDPYIKFPGDITALPKHREEIEDYLALNKGDEYDRFPPVDQEIVWTTPNDYSYLTSDWHNTFSIVTRAEVLFDMYIESMLYWRTVEDSPDVINVTMLCRRFFPPPIIENAYAANHMTPGYKLSKQPRGVRILEEQEAVDYTPSNPLIPSFRSVKDAKATKESYVSFLQADVLRKVHFELKVAPRVRDSWVAKWDIVANFVHRLNPFMIDRYTSRIESAKTIMIKNRSWFFELPIYRAIYFGFNFVEKIRHKITDSDKVSLLTIKNGVITDTTTISDDQLVECETSSRILSEPYSLDVIFDDVNLRFYSSGLKSYVEVGYGNKPSKQTVIYADGYYSVATIKNRSTNVVFRLEENGKNNYTLNFWRVEY